jgi:hypothetical protein
MHTRVGMVLFKTIGDIARVLHVTAIAERNCWGGVFHAIAVGWDATVSDASVPLTM